MIAFPRAVRQIVGPIFGDALFADADFNAAWRKIAHAGLNNRAQVDFYVQKLRGEISRCFDEWTKLDSIDLWDAMEELTIRIESYAFVGHVPAEAMAKLVPRIKYVVHASAHPLVYMLPNLPFGEPLKARTTVRELGDYYMEVLDQADANRRDMSGEVRVCFQTIAADEHMLI
jgi:hypothetical protein